MFWPPVRGDGANQTERWTLAGITGSNSDQGRVYVEITSTTLIVYKDRSLASSVAEITGGHGSPTTWTKKTLSALNTSGVTGSLWFRYSAADATLEVYPVLATDDEMNAFLVGMERWPYQTGETTWEKQRIKTREDFVAKMLGANPPLQGQRSSILGAARGSDTSIWRLNSIGDFEIRRMQNIWSFRNWSIWYTASILFQTLQPVLEDVDQIAMLRDAREMASAEMATTQVLVDADDDMDADDEVPRYSVQRG